MTDIARLVASLACCGGLLLLLGVAWGMCAVAHHTQRVPDRDWEEQ